MSKPTSTQPFSTSIQKSGNRPTARQTPTAPPAYRPQAVPQVLQRKPIVAPPRPTLGQQRFVVNQITTAGPGIQPKSLNATSPPHLERAVPQPFPRAIAHTPSSQARAHEPARAFVSTPLKQNAVQPMMTARTGVVRGSLSLLARAYSSKGGGGGKKPPKKTIKIPRPHYVKKSGYARLLDFTNPGKGVVENVAVSSTQLAKNMSKSYGKTQKKSASYEGHQAHHIIPKELGNHPTVVRSGLHLDDPSNGIFLPSRRQYGMMGTIHRGSHPNLTAAVQHFMDNVASGQQENNWVWMISRSFEEILKEGRLKMADSTEEWIAVVKEVLQKRYFSHGTNE